MRTVFLDTLAQRYQTIVILVHIIAILSALFCIVCVCIHIQPLRHREIPGCLCVGQFDLGSGNCLREALCPDDPAHLANGFVQIDLAGCDFLFQLLIGTVKIQFAGLQRNGLVCIQCVTIFITDAYPPAGSLAVVCISVGIDTVILLRLRCKEFCFIGRVRTDKYIRIHFQMIFQNVMHLVCIFSIFGCQRICRRNRPVTGRDLRHIRINQLGNVRQNIRLIDRRNLGRTTQCRIVRQVIVHHKFVYRCSVIGHLVDVANCFIDLLDMGIFCDGDRGVRVIDTHTLIVQIRTHRGIRLYNSDLCRGCDQIDLTRHNAVKGFDLLNCAVLCAVFILHTHCILQLHSLHGLPGEVEVIGIIHDITCRNFLPLFLLIDDIAVVVIDIVVFVLLRHEAAATSVVLAVCVPFCKQTILCDGKLAVCLFEGHIDLRVIVLPAAVCVVLQFQVVDPGLDLKVQRAVEVARRMIACHIGVVILAVETFFCRRSNLEHQRFTATLGGRVRPCQSVCCIFCRCNIFVKVPLCQLNAPAGNLCLRHGQCLLGARLICVFQIVVVH